MTAPPELEIIDGTKMFQIQNGDFWLCENKNGNCKVIISSILDLVRGLSYVCSKKNDEKWNFSTEIFDEIFEGTYDNKKILLFINISV